MGPKIIPILLRAHCASVPKPVRRPPEIARTYKTEHSNARRTSANIQPFLSLSARFCRVAAIPCIYALTRSFPTFLPTHCPRKLALRSGACRANFAIHSLNLRNPHEHCANATLTVPEYWIVEIEHERLHFFRSLADGRYTDASFTSTPGVTELPGLGGKTVDLSRLLTP